MLRWERCFPFSSRSLARALGVKSDVCYRKGDSSLCPMIQIRNNKAVELTLIQDMATHKIPMAHLHRKPIRYASATKSVCPTESLRNAELWLSKRGTWPAWLWLWLPTSCPASRGNSLAVRAGHPAVTKSIHQGTDASIGPDFCRGEGQGRLGHPLGTAHRLRRHRCHSVISCLLDLTTRLSTTTTTGIIRQSTRPC